MKQWRAEAYKVNIERAEARRSGHIHLPPTARVRKNQQSIVDKLTSKLPKLTWLLAGLLQRGGYQPKLADGAQP